MEGREGGLPNVEREGFVTWRGREGRLPDVEREGGKVS